MPGDDTKCRAMSGNGAKTAGIKVIKEHQQMGVPGRKTTAALVQSYSGAALGTTTLSTVVPLTVTAAIATTATTTTACVVFWCRAGLSNPLSFCTFPLSVSLPYGGSIGPIPLRQNSSHPPRSKGGACACKGGRVNYLIEKLGLKPRPLGRLCVSMKKVTDLPEFKVLRSK